MCEGICALSLPAHKCLIFLAFHSLMYRLASLGLGTCTVTKVLSICHVQGDGVVWIILEEGMTERVNPLGMEMAYVCNCHTGGS